MEKLRCPRMIKHAAEKIALIGGVMNAIRSGDLSPAEADELRAHYGLKPKGGLKTRNFWKGEVAGAAGGTIGSRIGGAVGGRPGLYVGTLAGEVGSAWLNGNKWTRGNLEKIRARNANLNNKYNKA